MNLNLEKLQELLAEHKAEAQKRAGDSDWWRGYAAAVHHIGNAAAELANADASHPTKDE